MTFYTFSKAVEPAKLQAEIKAAGLTSIDHIDTSGTDVYIYFPSDLSSGDQTTLGNTVTAHVKTTAVDTCTQLIVAARAFGLSLVLEFAAENVALGVTADGKTGDIINKMWPIVIALQSGSLYDGIARMKAVSVLDYDLKYITAARLLQYVNKIETYLGITLSTSL